MRGDYTSNQTLHCHQQNDSALRWAMCVCGGGGGGGGVKSCVGGGGGGSRGSKVKGLSINNNFRRERRADAENRTKAVCLPA